MNMLQLKAAVAAYAHRADLDPLFATFIQLAEQRIYNGETNTSPIRVAAMRTTATLADGTRPAGFITAKKIYNTIYPEGLTYRPLQTLPNETRAYSWNGPVLVLGLDVAFPVTMDYYQRLTPLANDTDTNWISENAPGVYLASVLIEVAKWSRDDTLLVREAANYVSAAEALQLVDNEAQSSGSLLTQRVNAGPQYYSRRYA